MSINVCPIATVNASLDQVWRLLSEPANYALWWDVQTTAIVPPGPAQPGQRIEAQTRALGRTLKASITVNAVDAPQHQLHLTTCLPLGITVHNHITCVAVDPSTSRVSFG
jgi:Polyketide cyclase / dehydrase and lipid transport